MGLGTTSPSEQLHAIGNVRADGKVLVGDGSAAAPSLTFVSDPDTGLYRGGANDLRIATGGAARLTVDANGKVSIAAPSSGVALEVAGKVLANVTDAAAYQFLNGGGTEGLLIDTTNKAVRPLTDNVYSIGAGAQRWSSLRVGTGDSTFAGKVGIGVTNPSVALDVSEDVKASNFVLASGGKLYLNGAAGARYFVDNPTYGWVDFAGGFQLEEDSELGLSIDDNGTVRSNGNLQVLRSDTPGSPTLWYLGRQGWHYVGDPPQPDVPLHTNYFFWESRTNQNGWYWSGWNTFRHPEDIKGHAQEYSVAWGYGYYPFRNMAKNYLLEADGMILSDLSLVGPTIYFQNPLHQDVDQSTPKAADGYDSDRHPYIELGTQTTLSSSVSAGSTSINVNSSSGFSAGDEIMIVGTGHSEINEVASVAGNTLYLERDTKAYSSGQTVKKVRELGGARLDSSSEGLAVYITRSGDDLVFKDNRGSAITLQQIRQGLGL